MSWSELRAHVTKQAKALLVDTGIQYRECIAIVVRGLRQEARS